MARKTAVLGIAGALALAAAAGAPHAEETLPVQLTVVPACEFRDTTASLDFGALDAARTAPVAATASLSFACTRGVAPRVSIGTGLHAEAGSGRRRMGKTSAAGADFLSYDLSASVDTPGAGGARPGRLTVTGTIAVPDLQGAAVGSYSDTVVLSITP